MRIAVTQGDRLGIGPELVVRTLAGYEPPAGTEILVLADPAVLGEAAAPLGLPVPEGVREVDDDLAALEAAAALARDGEVAAVVTAPVNKARLRSRGFAFPGQTEFFAERLGAPEHAMMLAFGSLRVVPFTTHLALADVPAALDGPAVARKVRVVHDALRRGFGIARPRIALLALNPHAGEEGLFGREEAEILRPAADALRAEGLAVEGPLPADAAFAPRARSRYDVLVGMYHDQVLAPFKALSGGGVNVTLGLPVVRTSPDHGTAEDIAGRGIADPASFAEALSLAVTVSANLGAGNGGH
jgi:4-hydroxythreonine-4-phosphate dehydrogenase